MEHGMFIAALARRVCQQRKSKKLSINGMEAMRLVDYTRINNTLGKMDYYLSTHNSICVSVSGGADSDIIVHMIAKHFRKYLPKIHFVFANTGIEYRATLKHLDELREKYEIQIDEVRGMPIPTAVKKYGVPFVSKQASEYFARLQSHGFDFEDLSPADLTSHGTRS